MNILANNHTSFNSSFQKCRLKIANREWKMFHGELSAAVNKYWCVFELFNPYRNQNQLESKIQLKHWAHHITDTGTCGQDPMFLTFFVAPPFILFFFYFLTSTFFHINNILQLSMYHCISRQVGLFYSLNLRWMHNKYPNVNKEEWLTF
jgi:hypothetical protein